MNIDVIAFEYVNLRKGNKSSLHCTYLRCSPKSSKVSFDGDSNTGGIHQKCAFPKRKTTSKSPSYRSHWDALRTTYGREKRAYNFIVANGKTVFYLTVASYLCQRNWRKAQVCRTRFSNIFFAYSTEEGSKFFVYDNVNLPILLFYYRYSHFDSQVEKNPLIVPIGKWKICLYTECIC